MGINKEFFVRRLAEVVCDEPKALAYNTGISLSAIYNYLGGKRIPTVEILFRIARSSGRSMEWFLVDDVVNAAEGSPMRALL